MRANRKRLLVFCSFISIFFAGPARLLAADSPDATPPPSSPIPQSADGSVTLPARLAVVHGTTIRYEPQPHKNTIGYWTKAKDWVSWDFQILKPGKFDVELWQACGKGSGGSAYTVTFGEQTLADTMPETGPSFTNWVRRTLGTVNLGNSGRYTVEVKALKKPGLAVMDLREIKLSPHADSK
jgi:hypothetical protein